MKTNTAWTLLKEEIESRVNADPAYALIRLRMEELENKPEPEFIYRLGYNYPEGFTRPSYFRNSYTLGSAHRMRCILNNRWNKEQYTVERAPLEGWVDVTKDFIKQ